VRHAGDKLRLYNKGAAEWVLQKCVAYHNQEGKVVPMTPAFREHLISEVGPPRCCVCIY